MVVKSHDFSLIDIWLELTLFFFVLLFFAKYLKYLLIMEISLVTWTSFVWCWQIFKTAPRFFPLWWNVEKYTSICESMRHGTDPCITYHSEINDAGTVESVWALHNMNVKKSKYIAAVLYYDLWLAKVVWLLVQWSVI